MLKLIMIFIIAGFMLTTQILLAEAQNYTEQMHDLDMLKHESLSNGKIFDRYLIPYTMSQANIEYFGGLEQANAGYDHLNRLLGDSKDNIYMKEYNHLTMLNFNFRILTNTTEPAPKVAALVIQEQMHAGTYQQPDLKPLKILHEYLMNEYPPTEDPETVLTEMFGEMKVLTPEVLGIVEKGVLFGNFPSSELFFANMDYWNAVGEYGDCVFVEEDDDDCDKYLENAEEISSRQHEDGTVSFDVPFDEQLLPTEPDAYSTINYLAEVYTRDCQAEGAECTYFKKKSSATGYASITYTGRDHVYGKYVVAYMKTEPTSDTVYLTVAFSEHWPGGTYKSALTTNDSATTTIASQSYQIGTSYTATVTYEQGAGFAGYAQD